MYNTYTFCRLIFFSLIFYKLILKKNHVGLGTPGKRYASKEKKNYQPVEA